MKRMLINATQPEELRVAIVDGQRLENLDIEHGAREQKKANVYKGIVTRVEPSLEAAFIDFGAERHGFLPFKEIARGYLGDAARNESGKVAVKEGLREGQELIVQVEKEERGNKGAALTTYISLAGRYLVLMPNNPRAGGVSRRIEGDERAEVRDAIAALQVPEGMGTIVRTAGVGRTTEELQWDLDYQIEIWKAICKAAEERKGTFLIYQESNVIIRALRDYFRNDISVIQIDEPKIYEQARQFIEQTMPHNLGRLKLYQDEVPLFSRFQIEHQIETAFQREATLPSGGALVIDHTEALISIDINSARSTKGADIEETAFHTNLEAADEIGRQLRLRDIGGLIVVDFIDMMSNRHQREVENRLREAVKLDRARVQIGRISRFGLLEMSRQRLQPSLGESASITCPRCLGHGTIRSLGSMSLAILRLLNEESMKDSTERVIARVPVEVATYLLNEKREQITQLEARNGVQVVMVPDPSLETPHYSVERVRAAEAAEHESSQRRSYEMVTPPAKATYEPPVEVEAEAGERPAVEALTPRSPAPAAAEKKPAAKPATPEPKAAPATATATSTSPGLLARIVRALTGAGEAGSQSATTAPKAEPATAKKADNRRRQPAGEGSGPSKPAQTGESGGSGGSGKRRRRGGRNRRGGRGGDASDSGKSAQGGGDKANKDKTERTGDRATAEGKPAEKAAGKPAAAPEAGSDASTAKPQQPDNDNTNTADNQASGSGKSRNRSRRGGRRRGGRRGGGNSDNGNSNADSKTVAATAGVDESSTADEPQQDRDRTAPAATTPTAAAGPDESASQSPSAESAAEHNDADAASVSSRQPSEFPSVVRSLAERDSTAKREPTTAEPAEGDNAQATATDESAAADGATANEDSASPSHHQASARKTGDATASTAAESASAPMPEQSAANADDHDADDSGEESGPSTRSSSNATTGQATAAAPETGDAAVEQRQAGSGPDRDNPDSVKAAAASPDSGDSGPGGSDQGKPDASGSTVSDSDTGDDAADERKPSRPVTGDAESGSGSDTGR